MTAPTLLALDLATSVGWARLSEGEIDRMSTKIQVECHHCGAPLWRFPTRLRTREKHFCSRDCMYIARNKRLCLPCKVCGTEMWRPPSKVARQDKHYCSQTCAIADRGRNKKKRLSPQRQKQRKTISRKSLQIAMTCEYCKIGFLRYPSAVRGAKQYCSRACRYAAQKDEINPNWKGGLVKRRCRACKKSFSVKRHKVNEGKAFYCSNECRLAAVKIYPDKKTQRHAASQRQRIRRYKRAKAAKNLGVHTEEEWQNLISLCKGRCVKCGRKRKLTRDHIIPISKGGNDLITNIQPLCVPCNSKKRDHVETLL